PETGLGSSSRPVRPPDPGPSSSHQTTGAGSGPPWTVLFEPFWSFAPSRSPRRGGLGPCRVRARSLLSIDERVVPLRQCSRASAILVHRILTVENSTLVRISRTSVGRRVRRSGVGCGHAGGSDALGGDRMRQGVGRGLSQRDVELKLIAVIV